jgi:hypothetical protein
MASAAVRAGKGSSATLCESYTRLKYSNNPQGVFMITAVSAIVAMLLAVAWAAMIDRVNDLTRVVQLAPRPIIRPDMLSVIGYEIIVIQGGTRR